MCLVCVPRMLEYLETEADYLVRRATNVFESESCAYCRLIAADLREKMCRLVRRFINSTPHLTILLTFYFYCYFYF